MFNLEHRKAKTPMITDHLLKNDQQATPTDIHRYQRKVGSIGYPASITRPDVCRTLQKLSEFLQNPSPIHEEAADHCIAYLNSTRFLALEYGSHTATPIFLCASDVSFADNTICR